jgi:hypothetical protein
MKITVWVHPRPDMALHAPNRRSRREGGSPAVLEPLTDRLINYRPTVIDAPTPRLARTETLTRGGDAAHDVEAMLVHGRTP